MARDERVELYLPQASYILTGKAFIAGNWLKSGALGRPRGMEWGGRREEGSGWGTHVYVWWIHFDIWQN